MFVNYSFFTLCLLHMAKCLWWLPFWQNFRNTFGVETNECALAEKTGTKRAILTKIGIHSIWIFILLIDTWHIIFIFFKWLLLVWTFRIYVVFLVLNHSKCSIFSLKHSHFTINKEGPNNGSTWPTRKPVTSVWYRYIVANFSMLQCTSHAPIKTLSIHVFI